MLTLKRIFGSFVLLIFLAIFSCTSKKENGFYKRKFADPVEKSLKELSVYKQINYIPAMSVAASLNGELIWSEAFGFASTDLEVPATINTKYRIGAVSEVITALIYNILVEKGKIYPDSTVKSYLPEFTGKAADVPIKYLANQSSGIRTENLNEQKWSGIRNTIETGLNVFSEDTLLFEPGFFQLPSIYNYNLLGAVIQKVENKNFHEVANELIIDTLGLSNTVFDNPFITIKDRPDFFDHNYISQVINAITMDLRYKLPSRGYLSTAEDLVKLGNAFLFSEYISESLKEKTFQVEEFPGGPSNWANGWFVVKNNSGRTVYGSQGEEVGGSAELLIYPDQKFVIAIATNLTDSNNSLPVFKIANFFLNQIENKKQKQKTQGQD